MGEGNGNRRSLCLHVLRGAVEELGRGDLPATMTEDGDLYSSLSIQAPVELHVAFMATCSRGGLEAVGGIEGLSSALDGVEEAHRRMLLERILRIPFDYGVPVAMPNENTLLVSFNSIPFEDAGQWLGGALSFTLSLATWLSRELERMRRGLPPRRFVLED